MHIVKLDYQAMSFHFNEFVEALEDTMESIAKELSVERKAIEEAFVTSAIEELVASNEAYADKTMYEQNQIADAINEKITDAIDAFEEKHFMVNLGFDYGEESYTFFTYRSNLTQEQYKLLMEDEEFI